MDNQFSTLAVHVFHSIHYGKCDCLEGVKEAGQIIERHTKEKERLAKISILEDLYVELGNRETFSVTEIIESWVEDLQKKN